MSNLPNNEPRIADTKPCIQVMEPGVYSWCTCGYSQFEPLCDGAHMGKGFCPSTFIIEKTQEVALCMCKRTKNKPWCDGSHQDLI